MPSKSYFLALIGLIAISACNPEPETIITGDWLSSVAENSPIRVLQRELLPVSEVKSGVIGSVLTFSDSSRLYIESLKDSATGIQSTLPTFQANYYALRTPGNIIRAQRFTQTSDGVVTCRGGLYFRLTQGEVPVYPTQSQLSLPPLVGKNFNQEGGASLYLGVTLGTGENTWAKTTAQDTQWRILPGSLITGTTGTALQPLPGFVTMRFFNNPYRWVNMGYPYTPTGNTQTVDVSLPRAFTPQNTAVYLMMMDSLFVTPLVPDLTLATFISKVSLPIGLPIQVAVLSKQGSKYYWQVEETAISSSGKISLSPVEVTFDVLSRGLNSL
jgi:hypothetical protein